jgi:hypothetical protein
VTRTNGSIRGSNGSVTGSERVEFVIYFTCSFERTTSSII